MKKLFILVLCLLSVALVLASCTPTTQDWKPNIAANTTFTEGGEDLAVAVDLKGGIFSEVKGNGITKDDYSYSQTTLTIKQEFLNGLEEGEYTFTLIANEREFTFKVKVAKEPASEYDPPLLSFATGASVFTYGKDNALEALCDFKGATLVSIKINGTALPLSAFGLSGGKLTIHKDYLSTLLPSAQNALAITTEGGTATANFILNDVPSINNKTDFIKYPGESVSKENFTGLAVNTIGKLTYSYALKTGGGTLTDHANGTFSYVPANINAGTAVITFTATDSYGASASKDITLTYKTVNPIISSGELIYNVTEGQDVTFNANKKGTESGDFRVDFVEITGNGITADGYAFDDASGTVTVKSAYLASLTLGAKSFVLKTTAGEAAFTITLTDNPEIELVSADNVVNEGAADDIEYTVDLKGADFEGIYLGESLLQESDYQIIEETLTVFGTYLNTLAYGEKQFRLVTSNGEAGFAVLVNDIPVINDKDDFIKFPGESVSGESFTGLVENLIGELTYTFSLTAGNGTLTDHANGTFSYIPADIYAGTAVITFTAADSYGASASRDITLIYKTVNPVISSEELIYNVAEGQDVTFTANKKGDESGDFRVDFVEITGNGITVDGYSFDDASGAVTVKSAYLSSLTLGAKSFVLKTTAGEAAFTITLTDNPEIELVSADNVVNEGAADDIEYTVDLKGADFEGIYLGETQLDAAAYGISGSALTVYGSYLSTLTYGEKSFRIETSFGFAQFEIIINDLPAIGTKDDLIKLPGEPVSGESFANLVTDRVGTLSFVYALAPSAPGTLTDNGNGTFNYMPDAVFTGSVDIVFTATDSFGRSAERTITLIYKTVNPKIYDADGSKIVDKISSFPDVVMTVDTYGQESSSYYFEMTDILLAEESIGSENYVLKPDGNPRYFSVKESYLRSLAVGKYTFTLVTTAGRADFIIEVKDSRAVEASPDEFEFTKLISTEDFTSTLTVYANEVGEASFSIDGAEFTSGTDFTYTDGTLTVYAAYLGALPLGTYTVRVNGAALITFTIKEASAPAIEAEYKSTIIEKAALAEDLTVACALYGLEAQTVLKRDGTELLAEYYTVTEGQIILKKEYILGLGYGEFTLAAANASGQDTFKLKISDKPSATDFSTQNVTKFTNETIPNEAFRIKAAAPWQLVSFTLTGATYYSYESGALGDGLTATVTPDGKGVSGDFGTITVNDAGKSFGVSRAAGWFGTIVFKYTAADELGMVSSEVAMDIVYMQRVPAIADKDSKIYFKARGSDPAADIVYTVTNAEGSSDFPIYKLFCGETELVSGADYAVGDKSGNYRYFTLNAAFLAGLDYGANVFTLYTEGGRESFTVTVADELFAAVTSAGFDKNLPADVTFSLSGYPLEIVSINGNGAPIPSEDYTFADGVLTIKSALLSSKAYGQYTVRASNTHGGVDLVIDIVDTREPEVITTDAVYAKGSMAAVEILIEMYGKPLTALNLSGSAVAPSEYTFSAGTLTINGSYLEAQEGDLLHFEIISGSEAVSFDIQIESVMLPEVTMLSSGFEIDKTNDVTYNVALNEYTFAGISSKGTDLVDGQDYSFDTGSSVLTIKGGYLTRAYRFGEIGNNFTLKTAENSNIGFTLEYLNPQNRILNGGFEAGSLYGFNSFAIWKNEDGMKAWTNDRVVSGGYFDQNYSYNRDGNYNLGIYGGAISKDSGQERMGHLRSSDFVLGGSGYISFKLGGGRNSSFAYLSVRKTSDNTEVARFGNPLFGTSTPTGNGEAYMFQYYYNLSANLGESLYFVLSDTTSNEWCVLSADSFFTYYAAAPSLEGGAQAINILPSILNVDGAQNSIINGNFDNGLDNWINVNAVFRIDSGFAISNDGGDAATGVLRSSAFSLDADSEGYKYIRFDWAGRLRADKQVFVSVKEVGTNIEVLRYVRRDNLSEKENGNFDNHILDLSSLDSSKLYYLEFADNVNDNWGVNKIDNVRLINHSEYLGITPDDRAVSIGGIETAFVYTLPY